MIQFISSQSNYAAIIDKTNRNGETSLHLCTGKQPNLEIAKLLLMNGSSPHLKNAIGETPLSLAKRFANHDMTLCL